jgi:hypothetical protein
VSLMQQQGGAKQLLKLARARVVARLLSLMI